MNNQGMIIENNAIYASRLLVGHCLDLCLNVDKKMFWKTVRTLSSDKISHKDIISLTGRWKNYNRSKRNYTCKYSP